MSITLAAACGALLAVGCGGAQQTEPSAADKAAEEARLEAEVDAAEEDFVAAGEGGIDDGFDEEQAASDEEGEPEPVEGEEAPATE